jgi:hypothetical protein
MSALPSVIAIIAADSLTTIVAVATVAGAAVALVALYPAFRPRKPPKMSDTEALRSWMVLFDQDAWRKPYVMSPELDHENFRETVKRLKKAIGSGTLVDSKGTKLEMQAIPRRELRDKSLSLLDGKEGVDLRPRPTAARVFGLIARSLPT